MKRLSVRSRILVVVLALLAGIFVAHALRIGALRRELAQHAIGEIEAIRQDLLSSGTPQAATTTTVANKYLLLGETRGKVSVYVRFGSGEARSSPQVYEYFYVRRDGEWILTESGRCTGAACQVRARKQFDK